MSQNVSAAFDYSISSTFNFIELGTRTRRNTKYIFQLFPPLSKARTTTPVKLAYFFPVELENRARVLTQVRVLLNMRKAEKRMLLQIRTFDQKNGGSNVFIVGIGWGGKCMNQK